MARVYKDVALNKPGLLAILRRLSGTEHTHRQHGPAVAHGACIAKLDEK